MLTIGHTMYLHMIPVDFITGSHFSTIQGGHGLSNGDIIIIKNFSLVNSGLFKLKLWKN